MAAFTGPVAPRKILTFASLSNAAALGPMCPVRAKSGFSAATKFPVTVSRVTQCMGAVFSFDSYNPVSIS